MFRFLFVALFVALVASFSGPAAVTSKTRCDAPAASMDRRAALGAAAATFFPIAANAEAAAIRKANQDDIGVSRVTIGKKGKGSPGAQVPEVPLKTDGWYRSAVIGPSTPTPKPPPPPPPPEPPKEEKKK